MEPIDGADLDWRTTEHGETHFRRKQLSAPAGGERLGCSLYELPPGAKSWPYHFHTGNEEALYFLAGDGLVHLPDGEVRVGAGQYLALPVGEDGAHRVVNDGDAPLRYLAMSTMRDPDITVYPDSGKIGVFAGAAPGGRAERIVHGYFREADAVDYWTGED